MQIDWFCSQFCLAGLIILTGKFFLQRSSVEWVCGIKPQVTFDVMCNSPYVFKGIQDNLQGESSTLSEVNYGFYPEIKLEFTSCL